MLNQVCLKKSTRKLAGKSLRKLTPFLEIQFFLPMNQIFSGGTWFSEPTSVFEKVFFVKAFEDKYHKNTLRKEISVKNILYEWSIKPVHLEVYNLKSLSKKP